MRLCRICKTETTSVVDLGDFYLSTFVDRPGDHIGKCPLHLVRCPKCTLVQLEDTAPQELLYARKYWYRSGINDVIREDLKDIVRETLGLVALDEGDIFLDIGANDGTLLSFVPVGQKIGVEPARNLQEELGKVAMVIDDFWENVDLGKKAKIITAIGMFYDSEDPNLFIGNVKKHLHENGIFISQLMTLLPMLRTNDLGNICHEHLEYYTYQSLKYLFESNGLEIYHVEENGINGGSYRLFARHFKNGSINWIESEPDFESFVLRITENKFSVVDFIQRKVEEGKKIYGFAASTKGNTILQWYGLTSDLIAGIGDRNPEKIGKLTVGTHIPIISEEEARMNADYFLVLPWGFLDSFMDREKEWRSRGGKFLTHTPKFSII